MDEPDIKEFSTHWHITKKVLENNRIRKIIEQGSGYYSSGLFYDRKISTTTIEEMHEGWYQTVKNRYPRLNVLFMPSRGEFIKYLKRHKTDLLFVDGSEFARSLAVQEGFRQAKIIIAHDTEALVYRWDRIKLPKGWVWVDIEQWDPWTAVITNMRNIKKNSWIRNYKHTIYTDIRNKKYLLKNVRNDI